MDLHRYLGKSVEKLQQDNAELVKALTLLLKAVNDIEAAPRGPVTNMNPYMTRLYDAADVAAAVVGKILKGASS